MVARDGGREPNASWQLRRKGRFIKMTAEQKMVARMTSKAAGQKKKGGSSTKDWHGRRIPVQVPSAACEIEGNKYSFNFKNMKVLVTPSEGDNKGNGKGLRT
ncbi:unnamed protein product [Urochloa humidicola]